MTTDPTRRFDVLVTVDREMPDLEGAAPPPPSVERVEEVRRWLLAHGATCHRTGFGLACSMPQAQADALFGEPAGHELVAPPGIAHLVDQITVPAEPEFF